jgi:hypothetical protein
MDRYRLNVDGLLRLLAEQDVHGLGERVVDVTEIARAVAHLEQLVSAREQRLRSNVAACRFASWPCRGESVRGFVRRRSWVGMSTSIPCSRTFAIAREFQ